MMCRERLENYLRDHGIAFGAHAHVGDHTGQANSEREHLPSQLVVRSTLVIAGDERVMLVFPASRQVDLALVAALHGNREVRLANEEELSRTFPGCEPGAIPPFGTLYGLPVIVDRSLEQDRVIFFPAGTQLVALSMSFHDYKRLIKPSVADFTHPDYREHAITTDMRRMGGM